MNKQIAILATACLVVSLVMVANILPRVLAQPAPGELEKQTLSSITNATKNQKTFTFPVRCDVPVLSQGAKWEDHCKLGTGTATNETTFPLMAVCVVSMLESGKGYEESCDLNPIR
jgi:hypothetical protein